MNGVIKHQKINQKWINDDKKAKTYPKEKVIILLQSIYWPGQEKNGEKEKNMEEDEI